MGAFRALLADDGLLRLLPDTYRTGDSCRLGQLPVDGLRLRSGGSCHEGGKVRSQMTDSPEQELARRTRRSFLALGAGAVAVGGVLTWLWNQPMEDEIPHALRSVLGFNEGVARNVLFSNRH